MFIAQLETYRNVQKTTMSGREIEAAVLTKAALMFKECMDRWSDLDITSRLGEAIKFNQLIWSVFQGELARPDNPLPKKLREDILSLSLFIDKRMFDVMAYPAPDKLNVLININLNLAAGLRGLSGQAG